MRSSTVARNAPAAPGRRVLPTSSWSNSTTTADSWRRSAPAVAATSASTAAWHDSRLSSRGAPIELAVDARASAGGVRSWTHHVPGEDVVPARRRCALGHEARRSRPRRRAQRPRPARGAPARLSTRPRSLTSRSRWMASCGIRRSGSSMRKQALVGAVAAGIGHGDPARQPEVAVEPRVEQHAAVDLDAELAAADPAGVGLGLDPQVRAVGVGADDPEPGAGPAGPPGDERRHRADEAGLVWRPATRRRGGPRANPAASRRSAAVATAWIRRRRGVDERRAGRPWWRGGSAGMGAFWPTTARARHGPRRAPCRSSVERAHQSRASHRHHRGRRYRRAPQRHPTSRQRRPARARCDPHAISSSRGRRPGGRLIASGSRANVVPRAKQRSHVV